MCGIFGMYRHKDAARLTYLGLYALQHRGEESAGIISFDGRKIRQHKCMGIVGDVFDEKAIRGLRGDLAVGHIRYSTTGVSHAKNMQPFLVKHKRDNIAIDCLNYAISPLEIDGYIRQNWLTKRRFDTLGYHKPETELSNKERPFVLIYTIYAIQHYLRSTFEIIR